MMMGIDDRQLRFEDRLLLLFCEPRIVRLVALTKPAWLNGLRHGEVPIFADITRIPGRDGYRLAFDARSKGFTRDSSVQADTSLCHPRRATTIAIAIAPGPKSNDDHSSASDLATSASAGGHRRVAVEASC